MYKKCLKAILVSVMTLASFGGGYTPVTAEEYSSGVDLEPEEDNNTVEISKEPITSFGKNETISTPETEEPVQVQETEVENSNMQKQLMNSRRRLKLILQKTRIVLWSRVLLML